MKLIEKLYLIPIIGLLIAIVWTIVDINYVDKNMRVKVMFYGGMLCHILVSEIIFLLFLVFKIV